MASSLSSSSIIILIIECLYFSFINFSSCQTLTTTTTTNSSCPKELQKCFCGYIDYNNQNQNNNHYYYGSSSSYPLSKYFGKNLHTFITNCTDTNFNNLNFILTLIPNKTQVLILNGNNFNQSMKITTTDKLPSLNKLLMLDLSRNQIKHVDNHLFDRMTNIETLILNDNQIDFNLNNDSKIMFKQLKRLEELHLRNATDNKKSSSESESLISIIMNNQLKQLKILNVESNQIDRIDNDNENNKLFCSSPQLRQILMKNNQLNKFHQNLSCLTELSLLDLSNNQLKIINNQTIQSLLSSQSLSYHINISENPFNCDCKQLDFYRFLHKQLEKNIFDHNHYQQPTFDWLEEYRCNRTGKYLDDMKENDFICDNHSHNENNNKNDWLMEENEISMINLIGTEPTMNEQEKKSAIERYRFYVTLSYFIITFLLLLLLLLICVLIYTNRSYLQIFWEFFFTCCCCCCWNLKRDYQALDKNNSSQQPQRRRQSSLNQWWQQIQQRRPRQSSKIYVNDQSSYRCHYTTNNDNDDDDRKNNQRYFIRHNDHQHQQTDIAEEQL
ncbi:uncharacterized protein LOC113790210 [Dermatophagoides pteronyssinus]|uniref:uncharacterized protein LOC113790210 n=1 Tax=Dermatophagoides pteronyssinus TaxID=6956 RepID=UPI003F671C1A